MEQFLWLCLGWLSVWFTEEKEKTRRNVKKRMVNYEMGFFTQKLYYYNEERVSEANCS